ncbi:MAG: tryptophan--tRNA ligase, partial [Geopsychrobacter sp.]|nr:tryptophan--tRNA ligase [Geopsychrobacter sp.]
LPVTKVQKPHLAVARDIAIKYHNEYGAVFTIPEPEIDENVATVPGLDGRKMSKSYGNTIDLFQSDKALRKQVMKIVTDATPIEEAKNPDNCNIFQIFSLFLNPEEQEELKQRYLTPGLRYGDVKQELFETIRDFFAPYREKREELLAKPQELREIMAMGADKARRVADKTMRKVRKKGGLSY